MKKILVLLAVVSLLAPISVKAQSTLSLQEKCAEGAEKFFEHYKKETGAINLSYTCHYNKFFDTCYILIEEPVPSDLSTLHHYRTRQIWDIFENRLVITIHYENESNENLIMLYMESEK